MSTHLAGTGSTPEIADAPGGPTESMRFRLATLNELVDRIEAKFPSMRVLRTVRDGDLLTVDFVGIVVDV